MDVTIAGGGTAGWIAAFALLRGSQINSLTLIEPSKIGTIGAGEASSGHLISLLRDYFTNSDKNVYGDIPRVDMADFFQKNNATIKYGILHKDWAKKPGDYFGPVEGTHTGNWNSDVAFLQAVAKFGNRKSHMGSDLGLAYEMRKMPTDAWNTALHFDAATFAPYMRDFLSYDPRLKVIDAPIDEVELDAEGNIENLILDDGSRVGGDLFVDATGFRRLLMNKLEVGWESYKDVLPVDSAMPFMIQYGRNEMAMPITIAQAMDAGWMWKTPLQHRRGAGYVYSSEFIDPDDAQKEVEEKLGHPIEPLGHLKFDSGKLEKFWVKNCLSMGLASSFIEPLEATAIHATVTQSVVFVREFMAPTRELTMRDSNRRFYNARMHEMLDSYKDFTVLHYQGGREDTSFWKYIKEENLTTETVKDYIDKSKSIIPNTFLFQNGYSVDVLWKWSLAGLDLITAEDAKRQLAFYNIDKIGNQEFMSYYNEARATIQKNDPMHFIPTGAQ